jgi:hypothetical protein
MKNWTLVVILVADLLIFGGGYGFGRLSGFAAGHKAATLEAQAVVKNLVTKAIRELTSKGTAEDFYIK